MPEPLEFDPNNPHDVAAANFGPTFYQIVDTHGQKVGAPWSDPEKALEWLGRVYQTDGLYSDNAGRIRTLTNALTRWNLVELEQEYVNSYRCPDDGTEWEDTWTATCNDRCPTCNKEIEPYASVDVE